MADTVKKSRIVSSENEENFSLEEIISEEFNNRLKCMSEQKEATNEEIITVTEENVLKHELKSQMNLNLTSEHLSCVLKSDTIHTKENGNSSPKIEEKLQSEGLQTLPTKQHSVSDAQDDNYINKEIPSPEVEYDPIPSNIVVTDVDNESLTAKERFLNTFKDIENERKINRELLLLSTDTALPLFTQTIVSSPMLTPTEETYDFLQNLKQTEPPVQEPTSISEISAENEVCILHSSNSEEISDIEEENLKKEPSNIEETFKMRPTPTIVEHLCDNSPDTSFEYEKNEETCQIIEDPEQIIEDSSQIIEDPSQEIENSNHAIEENVKCEETCDAIEEDNKFDEKFKENHQIVEEIDGHQQIFELNEASEFEESSVLQNLTECLTNHSSSITCESTYMETKVESSATKIESSGMQEKALKKKKSKKSKKDNEKENISVSELTNDDDTLSHVSVKNLCRSFSDLSSLSSKSTEFQVKKKFLTLRHKSMMDIRTDDFNVFSNVSVKSLRECFNNLTNKSENIINQIKSNKCEIKTILRTSDRIEKLKSSFSKFDALQKKTVLHVRSSDTGKAQEKFNGNGTIDTSNCKSCGKQVFQMEQIKAEKGIWHKNCFRCTECNKQLNVDTYQSNEGVLYCKPHFRALFTPKAVDDDPQPIRPRRHEMIIRENQPKELPPDVVRASDKPDLGLEELQNLNVKERFQVFEHHESQENNLERTPSTVNVKRSPSILSKLAKFQSKGMDIGVADESLNGIPVEESTSEEEEEEDEEIDGEDAELVRARRAQREKPMHFTNMSDVMSKWESGNQMSKEERREERKQEIQSIRSRLFMGKQAKIKEAYQQAVLDSSSIKKPQLDPELKELQELQEGAKSIREKFERGESLTKQEEQKLEEDQEIFEGGISKKSRSMFLEMDAKGAKPPSLIGSPQPGKEVKRAREAFMHKQASEDVVRSTDQVDDVEVKTADISSRFKFFETYKEPEKQRKEFRITPPRENTVKVPEPEIVQDIEPEVPDTQKAEQSHTATRMLSVFRQMEESANKPSMQDGPKPLKRFTPPPEPQRDESNSESEYTEEEDDDEAENEERNVDQDLLEAQKAARAKQLRAKFERWEANEIKREQNNSSVNLSEELGDAESQIESAKSLRARFESMRDSTTEKERQPRVKVNRFVDTTNNVETCKSCEGRVYPLEKISCHNNIYHKNCFRCKECNCVLRMDTYTYNQGLIYCLTHFKRLFISKGNYEAGFGLDQHKEKWNTLA